MKRILVTRPRTQMDSLVDGLRAAGFEPIIFPVIEIRSIENNPELDQALNNIDKYDWVVFTSVNGVEVLSDKLKQNSLLPHVAAIGPKTAAALIAHGVMPDFVPEEYIAEAILPGLGDLHGQRVLLPRAEIARKALPEAIVRAGGTAHEIAVYKTLPAQPDAAGLAAIKYGVDAITFSSPSIVENFLAILEENDLDPAKLPGRPMFACIGPITGQAAREAGIPNPVVAKEYTAEGLIEVIKKSMNNSEDS
jgi:uroporphyrinogen-III synthase